MGIVRGMIGLCLMGMSFYAGYKVHDIAKPTIVVEHRQQQSIEDRIKSLLKEDKRDVYKALKNLGREYGFEKQ